MDKFPEFLGSMSAVLIGSIGSIIFLWALSGFLERLVVSRLVDDPVVGKLSSVAIMYFALSILLGFVSDGGEGYRWTAFLGMLPAALVVGFFGYRRGAKLRDEMLENDVAHTFE